MLHTIGAILPNAVAIAVSPIPIIAVILMLMSPRSTRLGLAFLIGWIVGILVSTTLFALLANVVSSDDAVGPQPVLGVIQLLLGAGLLLLGARQWRQRPGPGEVPELPAWMAKIDSMGVPAAAGLAFALAALNPKNLLVAAAAGSVIGKAVLDVVPLITTILVFAIVAALTVLLPVVFALVAPRSAERALASVRLWLTTNNSVIITVLFVILGANVIGTGLGSF